MTEIRCFRILLLLLAATLLFGWGVSAYYLHDSRSALAEMQAGTEAKRLADRNCAAGIKEACPVASPYDNMPSVHMAGAAHLRSFDVNNSAAEAEIWFVYSTGAALALIVLFYAIRWGITGRLHPLWLLRNTGKEEPQ